MKQKYGIRELMEALKCSDQVARIRLRAAVKAGTIPSREPGSRWGWSNRASFRGAVKACKEQGPKPSSPKKPRLKK